MKSCAILFLLALGLVESVRQAKRADSFPWLKISRALRGNRVAPNATKPLIGMPDGHELSPLHRQHLPAWNQYKKHYARVYDSFEEEMTRFEIFVENQRLVNEHNKLHKEGKYSFEMSTNQYSDMTNSEFVGRFNGLNINTESKGRPLAYRSPVNVADLPDSVDWRTQGYVTPIKNQLHCGSCWSFSTTGALEGQWFAKSGKLISLSEQQLVDCSAKWGNNGCNGGLMDNAFKYIKDIGGLETESSYPYTGAEGSCQFNKSDVVAHDTGFVDVAEGDESALQQAVATVGPVSVAVDASLPSFQLYHTGVYNDPQCSSTRLDHGVLVVGYGTDAQSGDQYWIIKNSWGTGWGTNGYMLLARNQNNKCGVASAASYPTV